MTNCRPSSLWGPCLPRALDAMRENCKRWQIRRGRG